MALKDYEFWLIVGSQHLYGEETLRQVKEHAQIMTEGMNRSGRLPCSLVLKPVAKTPDEITEVMRAANADSRCAGVIVWMHTFSPSKMWIGGLSVLQKPYCHFATQFNRNIPNEGIDMDFMNLNQSAHGDREHGFIAARMRLPRKIVAGYWEDADVQEKIGGWMRAAVGAAVSRELKVMRFGDNMRQVAVTEGDKVEVQMKLGWQVNTYAVGDLVAVMNQVSEQEIDSLMKEYQQNYEFATDDMETVRYQAREEIAIQKMLDEHGCGAYTNTFEDLWGMEQLPGIASQDLMAKGYGYGGEGDWKVSALTHIMKQMSEGVPGGTAFMEDYTYDLEPGKELSLGAHMLEVCPSVAAEKPRIEVHPLGIGGKSDPVRLVFSGKPGDAVVVSMADERERFRLLMDEVSIVEPQGSLKNLPCARAVWKPKPDLKTAVQCWIAAGGSHHTCMTTSVGREAWEDFARIAGVELAVIDENTTARQFEKELQLSEMYHRLNNRH